MTLTFPRRRREALGNLLALGATAVAGPLFAADAFPSKPITLILPFPPGGSVDPVFRAPPRPLRRTWASPLC